MLKQQANLTVGYVAKRCGVKVSTLHFYEEKGLIRSWRNQGNQRRYKRDVLRRIAVIKAAQKIGINLDSIMQTFKALPEERTPSKEDWAKLSKAWRQQLDERIEYMTKLRDSVTGCIGCGCLSLDKCPIYNPQDEVSQRGSGAVFLNKEQP